MGVEYAHGLFVADLSWRAQPEHVKKIEAVLRRWKLVADGPPALHVTDDESIDELGDALPPNLRATYDGGSGEAIATVLGPSFIRVPDDQRYLAQVIVVLGVDFRVLCAESAEIEIDEAPRDDGEPIDECEAFFILDARSFPASWAAIPPQTTASGAFSGVFRSGILLDCGKDMPEIGEECDAPLPCTAFRDELEAALGTTLVEQGWIH